MIDKKGFIKKYNNFFEKYMKSMFRINKKRKKVPGFKLSEDNNSYFNPESNTIVIGIGIVEDFGINTEEELISVLYYIIGHEIQHTISTTERAWKYGLNKGKEIVYKEIAEYISRDYKKPLYVFNKQEDYKGFNDFIKPEGIMIDENMVEIIVHFIVNSLEDGRIERIRSSINPAFLSYMISARGRYWEANPINTEELNNAKIKQEEKDLSLLLNEILTIATMRLYIKDTFIANKTYNLGITEKVYPLLPYIKKGVDGKNCKAMADGAIALLEQISEDIYRAVKKDINDNSQPSDSSSPSANMEDFLDGQMTVPDPLKTNDREEVTDESGNNKSFSPFGEDVLNIPGESECTSKQNNGQGDGIEQSIKAKIEDSTDEIRNKIENTVRSGFEQSKEERAIEHDIDSARDEEAIVNMIDIAKQVTDSFDLDVPILPKNTTPPEIKAKGNVLKRKLKKILINKQKPNLKEQKSGSLDSLLMHRIAMKDVNIFEKKSNPELFDGCAFFLMDMSGSMCGKKFDAAIETLSLLEEAFKDLLPIKIVGFNSHHYDVNFHLIKDWKNSKKNCSYNFGCIKSASGSNMDGYAIQIAGKELLSMPYNKKLLYIISDGLPAYSDGESHTASVVSALRKDGIEISSIYIGDVSQGETYDTRVFKEMYKINCIITNIENICDDVIRKTKKFITR